MAVFVASSGVSPYLFSIGANLCFGTASVSFSKFALAYSPRWMNQLKASVAFLCFFLSFFIFEHYAPLSLSGNLYLLGSGFIGLFVGDLFLFRALAQLGPTRTLVLYSFQPFLLACYGYIFLGQVLTPLQILAIFCMIGCVFTFVIERSRTHGKFEFFAFFTAFLGIFFDAVGVMLSRQAYEGSQALGSFQANSLRTIGAMVGFFLLSPKSYLALVRDLKVMAVKDRNHIVTACVFGTYVSLFFYLKALKTANVATLTAISITLPIWASLVEHIRLKTWPNRYLWSAFALFIFGFTLLNL